MRIDIISDEEKIITDVTQWQCRGTNWTQLTAQTGKKSLMTSTPSAAGQPPFSEYIGARTLPAMSTAFMASTRKPHDYLAAPNPSRVRQYMDVSLKSDELLHEGPPGGEKDIDIHTPVLTITGWKTQGTLEVGHYVYTIDGAPTKVIAAHPVETKDCYRVTFSTGESITAGEGHMWNVATQRDRDNLRRRDPVWMAARRAKRTSRAKADPQKGVYQATITARRNRERADAGRALAEPVSPWDFTRTLMTRELHALVHAPGKKRALTIPRPEAIQGGNPWPSSVPPYVLGMWLGDGSRNGSGITQGEEDSVVLRDHMRQCGFENHYSYETTHYFRLIKTHRSLDSLLGDVFGTTHSNTRVKHIPDWVFTTSYESRLAVVQGLFDADAHVDRDGRIDFALTDERLFDDSMKLLSTLAVRVSKRTGVAAYRKADGTRVITGTRYRTVFITELPMFRYPRKLERINQDWTDKNYANRRSNITIESVEPCDPVLTRCIGIAHPSALYLAGRTLIPTHNA